MEDDDCYIYKIEVNDYLYIGSTKNIKKRQWKHNNEIKNGREYPLYEYCRNNDIKEVKLIILECVPLWERKQAEQYYIDEFSTGHKLLNCYNVIGDIGDIKLYKQAYYEAYYEANKDILLERMKAYHQANRDILLEKQRAYYEANKEKINERNRARYKAKKNNN